MNQLVLRWTWALVVILAFSAMVHAGFVQEPAKKSALQERKILVKVEQIAQSSLADESAKFTELKAGWSFRPLVRSGTTLPITVRVTFIRLQRRFRWWSRMIANGDRIALKYIPGDGSNGEPDQASAVSVVVGTSPFGTGKIYRDLKDFEATPPSTLHTENRKNVAIQHYRLRGDALRMFASESVGGPHTWRLDSRRWNYYELAVASMEFPLTELQSLDTTIRLDTFLHQGRLRFFKRKQVVVPSAAVRVITPVTHDLFPQRFQDSDDEEDVMFYDGHEEFLPEDYLLPSVDGAHIVGQTEDYTTSISGDDSFSGSSEDSADAPLDPEELLFQKAAYMTERKLKRGDDSSKVSRDKRLYVFGRYMQATRGDNDAKKNPYSLITNIKANYKWDAWKKAHGLSQKQAKRELVEGVIDAANSIKADWLTSPDLEGFEPNPSGFQHDPNFDPFA